MCREHFSIFTLHLIGVIITVRGLHYIIMLIFYIRMNDEAIFTYDVNRNNIIPQTNFLLK